MPIYEYACRECGHEFEHLLRTTRERGERGWEEECCAERLEAAGMACEALHRRGQARALYRLAVRGMCHGQMDGAQRRLEALEAATRSL